MARNTYNTILKYRKKGTGAGEYTKLVDIKDFPDLGGEPELLETTTLSNKAQTYINGIQSMDALTFTYNYDKQTYSTIKELEGEQLDFQLCFGSTSVDNAEDLGDGEDGIFEWSGDLVTWVTGGGVNEVVEATLSIAPSTEVKLATA